MQAKLVNRIMSRATVFGLAIATLLVISTQQAHAVSFEKYPQASVLVEELTNEYDLDSAWVEAVIRDAVYTESIINAITRPAEKFPWYRYRSLFVKDSGAKQGVKFWNKHEETLQRAEQEYGVPPAIIIAIIGVETRFGRITGKHRVIDSLVTLVLGYPKRKKFFQKELAEFIKLTEEEGLNPFAVRGSYAGAMGIPQFISSSYRHYAVDFNNNEKRDLLTETADAIGSVANYLNVHGWKSEGRIYTALKLPQGGATEIEATKGLKPDRTLADLPNIAPEDFEHPIAKDQSIGVVKLETKQGHFEDRITFPNFYVITTYNRSNLYAMAVAELAEKISQHKSAN